MVSRRKFLAVAGAGVVASALEIGGLDGLGILSQASASTTPTNAGRGLFGGLTTLDRTVVKMLGTQPTGYMKLDYGAGEGHLRRSDLYSGLYRHPTISLGAFVQISDMQICDDKSPARVEFTDRWANLPNSEGYGTDSAYRPHEFLSTHLVEAMTKAIRSLKFGPKTGLPLAFTIATGDMVDNCQYNETRWYIDLLDGNHTIVPDSGQHGLEQTVSANFGKLNETLKHDLYYWYPEAAKAPGLPFQDDYQLSYGYPVIPGLLAAARTPYLSTGLGMPWYAAMGNHDGEIQGNYPVHPSPIFWATFQMPDLSGLASGGMKAIGAGHKLAPDGTLHDYDLGDDVTSFAKSLFLTPVAADPYRRMLTQAEFLHEHFATTGLPDGHGFAFNGPGYYTFPSSDSDLIQYITLDTVNYDGGSNGRIIAAQFDWLRDQLKANSNHYLKYTLYPNGGKVYSQVTAQPPVQDKLFVIFCHHTIDSIDNKTDFIDVADTDFYYKKDVEELLLMFPNVIAVVNGHTHANIITPHRRGVATPLGNNVPGAGGFWEINTASHVDWPSQSRILEIAAGGEAGFGTAISIYTTMVDIDAPANYNGDLSNPSSLASLARELAANDPTERPRTRRGNPADRNTQLMLPAPFPLPVTRDWGTSLAMARNNDGKLLLYGTNPDDYIFTQTETSPGSHTFDGWGMRQGRLRSVAAEIGAFGRITLVGINSDGYLFHQTQPSAGAQFLDNWTYMPDKRTSIALARNPDDSLQLITLAENHQMLVSQQTSPGASTWTGWEGRGSDLLKVAADTSGAGIEVFGLTYDGTVLHLLKSASTGQWGGWAVFEPNLRFSQMAVTSRNGKLVFFGIDEDWKVWYRYQATAGSPSAWQNWQSFDGRMTQIAACTDAGGQVTVLAADNAGNLWFRTEKNLTAGWFGWTSLQGVLRPDVPAPVSTAVATPPPKPVIVPNVLSWDQAVAEAAISAVGLNPVVSKVKNKVVGTVLVQHPSPGNAVPAGSIVDLTVGKSDGGPPA